jgi:methionyl-tRNA synthetase
MMAMNHGSTTTQTLLVANELSHYVDRDFELRVQTKDSDYRKCIMVGVCIYDVAAFCKPVIPSTANAW